MDLLAAETLVAIMTRLDTLSRVRLAFTSSKYNCIHKYTLGDCKVVVRRRAKRVTFTTVNSMDVVDGDLYVYTRAAREWRITTRAVLSCGLLVKSWRFSIYCRLLDVIRYNGGTLAGFMELSPDGAVQSLVSNVGDATQSVYINMDSRRAVPQVADMTRALTSRQEICSVIALSARGVRATSCNFVTINIY